FFPPSKTTNLRNEITRFQQSFDESFYEAWDRFNDLLRACPHHGFSELHQLNTFYNALNVNDQDSLNSAAGGNFLDKMPRECLKIIESKSKVRQSRAKVVVAKIRKTQSSAPASSSTPAPVKAGQNMQSQCQGLQTQLANLTDMLSKFVSSNTASSSGSGILPSNTIANPKEDLKGPTIPTQSKVVKQRTEVTNDQVQTPSSQSTAPVQPPVVQTKTQTPVSEPVVAPVSASMPNLNSSILYPLRRDNERRRDQANEQIVKFYEIFKEEKLSEMARTLMNEHCSVVILNMLPRKLRDPGKLLIPCEFSGMDECLAFADLGASINLMPLSLWKGVSLLELTLTCMTLELADRSVSKPIGIAKDIFVKVGVFH
nr:hypothetical protein [Tanacetum cinerariifolium]